MLSALFLNFIREVQECQGTCIYIYCDAHHKYRRISFHLLFFIPSTYDGS
ncbi:hypothetical protein A628_00092 [Salmonella enterica subsp. enterica serovar Cubana str. 76814]|uniref:Uncharacterized protein n=1 Tax=Salmonella enterica subsp. enterica serovar Cubana str. 76814 TaxID=1192560 RepID=V7IX48_SALET|nr:hypothetical protein A628_00092 [Salmonella enterica subsp. enterica serovar Cubana str. 76814]